MSTVNEKSPSMSFVINTKIYALSAILKTCYLFTEKLYVYLDFDNEDLINVRLKPKKGSVSIDENLIGEFHNELLNQVLRLQVYQETKYIRQLIFARALHSATFENVSSVPESDIGLTDGSQDYFTDSLKIGETWFKVHPEGVDDESNS